MKNRFQHFPVGVFLLKSLSWLILSGCTIERIPTDWPKGNAPLQMNQVDLTENFIQVSSRMCVTKIICFLVKGARATSFL